MVDATVVGGVVFAGCVLGSFGRAMFPYLRKLKEKEDEEAATATGMVREKPVKFQRKYLYSTIFSAILSLIVGMTLFPGLVESALNTEVQQIQITNGTASTEVLAVDESSENENGMTGLITESANTGLAGIFMSTFLTAWGANSIINNIIATGKETQDVQPGSLRHPTTNNPQLTAKDTTTPTPAKT